MKPKDLIPTPCHEDWNSMTGDQQRKFCGKCSTHVHDLTDFTTEEILALKVQNGGKLCGAFRIAKPVIKPLTIGAGIASLALASCKPEPLVGVICPPDSNENNTQENSEEIEVRRGRVRIHKSTSANSPDKSLPTIGMIAAPKKNAPEPALHKIGEVILEPAEAPELKAPQEELLLGDICLPEETETNSGDST